MLICKDKVLYFFTNKSLHCCKEKFGLVYLNRLFNSRIIVLMQRFILHIAHMYNFFISNCIATVWTGPFFYSNMTVSLCISQGSKINDDSVSVEELDWSAESQVLIPAEHLWCDFKCRP